MRPVRFRESNGTLTGGSPERYGVEVEDLSVWRNGAEIISAWKPSLRERLSLLIFGRVWLRVRSRDTHAPVSLMGIRTVFEEAPDA